MIRESAMARARTKVQDRLAATTPSTWGKAGAGVLLGGLVIGWVAFPYVLDKVVASQINLAEGKDTRQMWIRLPALDCKMFIFNITNPGEVMRGAKPVVREVGPYCYKEIKDKTDFVEDSIADTISYSARTTWIDDQKSPDCPAPQLTGDEMVVVPNVPMLAVLLLAEKDFPAPFLTLVNQALPNIFGKFNDIFMRVSARKLLFDGIPIDCTSTSLYARAVCIALKQNSRALKKLGENRYSFSFFGAKNHTAEEFRYTVKRGTEDGQEIGKLVALDGKPELQFWRGDCNTLQGTDGSVFPPFRKKENGSLMAYSSEMCRVLVGTYMGEYEYKGVTGYAYTTIFGDTETNPADSCYCPIDDRCRKKGVLDTLKCIGAPIVTSHPHFYLANQEYVDAIEGLNPDKDKHEVIIVLEPISGGPLYARKRLQFNIDLKPVRYVTVTQRLPRVLMPLFWAEEGLDLDEDLMGLLEASLFRPIRAVDVMKWMTVTAGVALGVTAVVLKVRKVRRDKVQVLKGSAGREFGYESNPKEAVKPVSDENPTHPFYINGGFSNGTNGLSAEALLRQSQSSKTETEFPEGFKSELLENGSAGNPSHPFHMSNGFANDINSKRVGRLLNRSQPSETQAELFKAYESGVQIRLNDENNGNDNKHIQTENFITQNGHDVTSSQVNNISNIFTEDNNKDGDKIEPRQGSTKLDMDFIGQSQLKTSSLINSSLEHQTSIIASSSPTLIEVQNESLDHINSRTMNENINSEKSPSLPNYSDSAMNIEIPEDERSEQEDGLAKAVESWSGEDYVKQQDSSQGIAETKPPIDDHQPTAEELQAVEEDISKLMAEMAELIPKKHQ